MLLNILFLFFTFLINSQQQNLLELPIYALVPTYNNIKYCEQNFVSIINQNYNNFKLLIIDDASKDGTATKIEDLISKYNVQDKVIFVKNKTRKMLLYNYLNGIKNYCPKDSIIVGIDGDDWLADNNIFSEVNKLFQNDIWLTYGNPTMLNSGKKASEQLGILWGNDIPKHFFKNNYIRKHKAWFFHHLRCFWSWLFLRINENDLKDKDGNFYDIAQDVAWFMPMLEMAGPEHIYCFKNIDYIYNDCSDLNNEKINKRKISFVVEVIMKKRPYKRLKHA